MSFLKVIKKIGNIIPGRIGDEMVGFSVRQGNVRQTMKRTILMAIKKQNSFLGKSDLKILVIGTESCSKYDADQIGNECDEVWTLDIKEGNRVYGVRKGRHITASTEDIDKYFRKGYFDIVLLNGVIGWGINSRSEQEEAIKNIHYLSKENALLMIGWNTHKSIDPLVSGITVGAYHHQDFPGLPKRMVVTESTHIFDFFAKV
ncbi:hypothetical protein [Saccharibacter floricola]|uniref:Methyltransferase n=1 Tax=Saccharibacter floricola DSM 15669 TaxID=1123227 RepID=A0ABQ0NZ48_9PROT|nr:hypothetical protein [Saccharibacter floricola]GBQ06946.1 methyltransferase [Saccharibacter floricola DSM 15669]